MPGPALLTSQTEVQRYLALLFPDPPDDAWLVVSWLVGKEDFRSQWFLMGARDDICARIIQLAQQYNVYVGMGLRHPQCTPIQGTRGKSEDVFALGGLWVELDHSGGVHAAKNLPSPTELQHFVTELPFRFSLLVQSGGGIHGYLLFRELWILDTPAEHEKATQLLKRFQRTIQLRAAAQRWKIDSTADLARVLRPAGTLNYKGATPEPVRISDEYPLRYNPSDIADEPWLVTTHDTYTMPTHSGTFPSTLLDPIMHGCAWLRHTHDDAMTLPEPEWYAMLSIVGRCLDGDSLAQAWSAPYPTYEADATTKKLHQAIVEAGPRSCGGIRYGLNADEYCESCPHWGTIISPIVLGMPVRIPSTPHDPFGTGLPSAPQMDEADPSRLPRNPRHPSRTVTPIIITMDSVTAQPIEWLWWPYLALGTLAMLDGDPGIGKSLLTSQLAASISRGWGFPNQQGVPEGKSDPADSVFLAREDSLVYTVRKRLDTLHADVAKIHYLTGWKGAEDEEHAFTLADMDVLYRVLDIYHPRLVVLDPIQGYLGAKVDINRSNETRPLLDKLSLAAETYRCTILCVRHPAKASGQGGGKAMLRGLGSVDFIGAARTGLFVEQHPLHPDLALMAMSKSNVSAKGRTHIFSKADGIFAWAGVTRMDAEILAGSGRGPDPHAFLEAYLWLEKRLEGGIPVPSADLEMQADEEKNIALRTLRRAKKALQIISIKKGEGWLWKLSDLSILSPPLPLSPGPLESLGTLGTLGTLGPLQHLQGLTGHRGQGVPEGREGLESQDGQVGQVVAPRATHARDTIFVPEIQPRTSSLMAWHPCPQCHATHWAPDTGGPLACLACGYVTE